MKCPNCGAEMVLRKARRGKYKGKNFYGCSNYPKCKTIVNLESVGQDKKISHYKAKSKHRRTVDIASRVKKHSDNVMFFETISLPNELLEVTCNSSKIRNSINNYNVWRVDYNEPKEMGNFLQRQPTFRQVLLIAYKILNRGKLTRSSPNVENKIKKIFNIEDLNNFNNDFSKLFMLAKSKKSDNLEFDGSGYEEKFYYDVLKDYLGEYYRNYVLTQVKFTSLVDKNLLKRSMINSRVDFLISYSDKKIIVEIDDPRHQKHKERDNERDSLLRNSGYEVIRIKNQEVIDNKGKNIERLKEALQDFQEVEDSILKGEDNLILAVKMVHQLQITILQILLKGYMNRKSPIEIIFDDKSVIFSDSIIEKILKIAEDDFNRLVNEIGVIYGLKEYDIKVSIKTFKDRDNGIVVTYSDSLSTSLPVFIIQDFYFCDSINQKVVYSEDIKVEKVNEESLEYLLNYIFRKSNFWEGQYEAISRTLLRKDSVVLLPTGSGKTIAFQLAAFLMPSMSLVVDPIIALINDQLDNLVRAGIDRVVGITSEIRNIKEKQSLIEQIALGQFIFVYVAPERLQTQDFRDALTTLTVNTPVSLIVIDEAHCVSEWGHDFRTAYLNIGRITRKYCSYKGKIPPLLALTGTASNSVLRDVQRELQINDFEAVITPKTFDRKELRYNVQSVSSSEKEKVVKGLLSNYLPEKFHTSKEQFYTINGRNTKSGIIFCPHINGQYGIVQYAEFVSSELSIDARMYGGKSPKRWNYSDWIQYKKEVLSEFKQNNFSLLIATKSFGMGIDKSNIRYTIHLGLPNSVESFYQEAGRAGRDKSPAECIIIYSNDNQKRAEKLLSMNSTIEDISEIMKNERSWENDDDITRAMWFHNSSFRGIKEELKDIKKALLHIKSSEQKSKLKIVSKNMQRENIEKAIHRLLVLGIVEDYTLDYSSGEFSVSVGNYSKELIMDNYAEYVKGYNKGRVYAEFRKLEEIKYLNIYEFILEACRVLLEFIYDTIEKGRRRALREILAIASEASSTSNPDRIVRDRVTKYLESDYYEELETIVDSEYIGFRESRELFEGKATETGELIGGIRSSKDAIQIRGQIGRYLESLPDHPALLFLRAIAEAHCPNMENSVIEDNIKAAVKFSLDRYNLKKEDIFKHLAWVLSIISIRNFDIYEPLAFDMLYKFNSKTFAKALIMEENSDAYMPAKYLFNEISKEVLDIIKVY